MSTVIRVCFGYASLRCQYDWLENIVQISQPPIRSKYKTNGDLLAAFSRAGRRLHIFASSSVPGC